MTAISYFDDFRKILAVPSRDQVNEIQQVAQLIYESVTVSALRTPEHKLDLRFTVRSLEFGGHPVGALMVTDPHYRSILGHGQILLNIAVPDLSSLFLHEIGHYYDFCCYQPYAQFSSPDSRDFDDWRAVVMGTETFQIYLVLMGALSGLFDVELEQSSDDFGVLKFDDIDDNWFELVFVEGFARCFCQWIVGRWAKAQIPDAKTVIEHFNMEFRSQEAEDLHLYWNADEMVLFDKVLEGLLQQ